MKNILEVKNLSFSYGRDKILDSINLNIEEGEFAVIFGDNGAGKSTLVKLILGELKPESGQVKLNLNRGYMDLSYVPQLGLGSSYNFPITCGELVGFSIKTRGLFKGREEKDERILNALSQVGMEAYKNTIYYKLSGGQRQRVLIAKALASHPKLIVMDEPSNGIDREGRRDLYHLLEHLNKYHKISILIISHDDDIKNYAESIYLLEDKKLNLRERP
ncbi:metal ABC transporter ATP-binding protein [Peptoniphilus catoniae]|uniref:metal ABC transporter ATP-binding protein n=1 Tax=Peptoniphilus catoniae TaxID=1660341 RepID=UPI0010FDCA48|nr:ATP-binding cassette domain-containing protein [Peptoniphilus catoniae]